MGLAARWVGPMEAELVCGHVRDSAMVAEASTRQPSGYDRTEARKGHFQAHRGIKHKSTAGPWRGSIVGQRPLLAEKAVPKGGLHSCDSLPTKDCYQRCCGMNWRKDSPVNAL